MAKTILHVKKDGIQFFLNTESSSPATGHRNRFRLFKTEDFGREKMGWVSVGSTDGREIIAINNSRQQFDACVMAFNRKRPHKFTNRTSIRGLPGKWEGEAFPSRLTSRIDAATSAPPRAVTTPDVAPGQEPR
jgi:hypothetical protein